MTLPELDMSNYLGLVFRDSRIGHVQFCFSRQGAGRLCWVQCATGKVSKWGFERHRASSFHVTAGLRNVHQMQGSVQISTSLRACDWRGGPDGIWPISRCARNAWPMVPVDAAFPKARSTPTSVAPGPPSTCPGIIHRGMPGQGPLIVSVPGTRRQVPGSSLTSQSP